MGYKIGIDVGGTFTDFIIVNEHGIPSVYKILSTPDDPSTAVLNGLKDIASAFEHSFVEFMRRVDLVVHGTTVTTNSVLTGNITRTGLLTTRGFRDALEMRRGIREEPYNNRYLAPPPLVPRYLRMPITERTDYKGVVLSEVKEEDIKAASLTFARHGVKAVAICFMHSYANGKNERVALEQLRKLMPDAFISASSDILPQVRFYERTSTTVLNAAVGPVLNNYLSNLEKRLREVGFNGILLVMQSNGGVSSVDTVKKIPSSTLLSGPAAAPAAGIVYAKVHQIRNFITVDMGGTSFDAALTMDCEPAATNEGKINRYAIALPMMEINTIGAGGGSIAWIDDGGLLRMGPKSAGARPGPACYGLGGEDPTCSDANLILGYLNEDFFAGGRMPLDRKAAEKAIKEKIASPLGMDMVSAAFGMYQIMNINMASAIREISIKRGLDPREFLLICAGGAGPIHAAMIASELEMPRILIPRESSIFCAAGMLLSDFKHDLVRTYHAVLTGNRVNYEKIIFILEDLRKEGEKILSNEQIPTENRIFKFSADLRYVRQYHEVNVPIETTWVEECLEEKIKEAFHERHDSLYGYNLADEKTDVELVNIRMTATGITDKPSFPKKPYTGCDASSCLKGKRPVFIPKEKSFQNINVYDGDIMGFGHRVEGPAVIEQVNTTIFVPPDFYVVCDEYGNYMISISG